jgi:hypothetical protein
MLRTAAVFASLSLLLLGTAVPAAADEADYIALLDNAGVSYSSEEGALGVGTGICRVLGNGGELPRVLNALNKRGWDTPGEQSVIIAAAGTALCPDIRPIIQKQLSRLSSGN